MDSEGERSVIFSGGSVGVDGGDLWCSGELSGDAVTKRADQSGKVDGVVRTGGWDVDVPVQDGSTNSS